MARCARLVSVAAIAVGLSLVCCGALARTLALRALPSPVIFPTTEVGASTDILVDVEVFGYLVGGPNLETYSFFAIDGSGAGPITVSNETCPISPQSLPIDQGCQLRVTFAPTTAEAASLSLPLSWGIQSIGDPVGGGRVTLTAEGQGVLVANDSDGDGVDDSLDLCPNTPAGTPVDEFGCPLPPPGPFEDSSIEALRADPRFAGLDGELSKDTQAFDEQSNALRIFPNTASIWWLPPLLGGAYC